jgi:prepilin-type processing-associated H-X9-DG protein
VSTVSSLAVWSLVLGICSFLCGPVTAIPAIICAVVAQSRIRQAQGQLQGQGLALAGFIMGLVGATLFVVGLLAGMLLPAVAAAREKARRTSCMSNLGALGKCGVMYSMDNDRAFPDFKSLATFGANAPKLFICKSSGHLPGDIATVDQWTDYILVPVAVRGTNDEDVVAFDKAPNHKGKGGNVLYVDGSVTWLNTEDFNKAVAPFLQSRSGPSPGQ